MPIVDVTPPFDWVYNNDSNVFLLGNKAGFAMYDI
jgi:hypothetical protein